MALHGRTDAVARVRLLAEYFPWIVRYEMYRLLATGTPVGGLVPPGPAPATTKNWGPYAHTSCLITSRDKYLRHRHPDWIGGRSRKILAHGADLAAAIGRTGQVVAFGGVSVALKVVRRLFRYEGEQFILGTGQPQQYEADFAAIDPDSPGSWVNYAQLFQRSWQDTGGRPNPDALVPVQKWGNGLGGTLPPPF